SGSAVPDARSKPTLAPSRSPSREQCSHHARHPGRRSAGEPSREVITANWDLGLRAQRIYQDLITEHDFTRNYYTIRRFVRQLTPTTPLPYRRLECGPGDEAQVDFGTGARMVGRDGKRRNTHLFRIVLSHSRKAYSEAVYRQTSDEFLRCLES